MGNMHIDFDSLFKMDGDDLILKRPMIINGTSYRTDDTFPDFKTNLHEHPGKCVFAVEQGRNGYVLTDTIPMS